MAKDRIEITFMYLDLVIDTGELITVEYIADNMDDIYATLENSMKKKELWSTSQWDLCKATFMGISIERVNMARVIGIL
jgi:hypothetical protein